MTWNDEIVTEVRRVREEHAEKFNYDISTICADIRRKQAESGRKVISLEQKEKEKENPDILQAAYMSPEQARGKEVDSRSDVCSFGVMMYEILGGRAPFTGETMMDVISAIMNDEAPHGIWAHIRWEVACDSSANLSETWYFAF